MLQVGDAPVAVPVDGLLDASLDVGGDLVWWELDRGVDVADGPGGRDVGDELFHPGDQVRRAAELVERRWTEQVPAAIELHRDVVDEDVDAGAFRLAPGSERDSRVAQMGRDLVTVPAAVSVGR
jgi:hypothetical protein